MVGKYGKETGEKSGKIRTFTLASIDTTSAPPLHNLCYYFFKRLGTQLINHDYIIILSS